LLKEEAEFLGLALKTLGRRNEVYLSAMIIFPFKKLKDQPASRWCDILLEIIEERPHLLQTGRIDIFHVHMPEDNYSSERPKFTLEALGSQRLRIGWAS